jgi:FkbM family methyltransferase
VGPQAPPHVTLRREALAERSGMTTISAPRIGGVVQEEWASICKDYAALREADTRIEAVETWSVPLLRLDDTGLADVTAIKIDVEGAELEVLRGAWMTLQRWRPACRLKSRSVTGQEVPALFQNCSGISVTRAGSSYSVTGGASSNWISQRCSVPPRHQQSSRSHTRMCSASTSCRTTADRI